MYYMDYIKLNEIYNLSSLDSELWIFDLYFCFIREFLWSFIFYIILIIAFCAFLETLYYIFNTLSYWKTHDIRNKLTDNSMLMIMKYMIEKPEFKPKGKKDIDDVSYKSSSAYFSINVAFRNKSLLDYLAPIVIGQYLHTAANGFDGLIKTLNLNNRSLFNDVLIDENNVLKFNRIKFDFLNKDECKKYIYKMIECIQFCAGKSNKITNDVASMSHSLLLFDKTLSEIILLLDYDSFITTTIGGNLPVYESKVSEFIKDYIFTEYNINKYLAYRDGMKMDDYSNTFNNINNLSKVLVNSIDLFSFTDILKDALDPRRNEYKLNSYVDYMWLSSHNVCKSFCLLISNVNDYIAKERLRIDKQNNIDEYVANFIKQTYDFHALNFIKNGANISYSMKDLFNDIISIEENYIKKLEYKNLTNANDIELLFKNKIYKNNKLIKRLLDFKNDRPIKENESFVDLTSMKSSDRYLHISFFSNLNDIYYKELVSSNPISKWALTNLFYGDCLIYYVDIDAPHADTCTFCKMKVLGREFKEKYVFLKIIADDNEYLKLSIAFILSGFGWWILFEIGFRVMSSIQDFNEIALSISPIFNANIEYVNRKLFLDFSRYICDFHHIVFISILFVFWLVFSFYSYIRYFDILFKVLQNFAIHMMSFVMFVFLIICQKDVVNISCEEMMIDYSDTYHVVVSGPENVIKYYRNNISKSRYNKWSFVVFFVFSGSYIVYSLFSLDLSKAIVLLTSNMSWRSTRLFKFWVFNFFDSLCFNFSVNGIFFKQDDVKSKMDEVLTNRFQEYKQVITSDSVLLGVNDYKSFVAVVCIILKMIVFIFFLYMSYSLYSVGGAIRFFIIDYANLWFIFKSPEDIAMMTEVNNIDEMTLKIDRYILFDLDETKFDISKKKFIFMFKNAMFAGDFDEMNNLLDSCEHEDLKTLIKSKLNDNKNLLLHNIDIKFKGNELEIIEDEWRYKLSANMVELHGASGTGKSTIQNFLIGKRKYIGAKVNDILTYYMNPTSRHLLPSFSSSYTNYFGTVSLFDNLQNADENFNKDSSVFRDLGISKYSEQLSSNYSDIFMSMGQRCRMDFVYFFTQLDSNIESGRTGFMSFMDEPFGALDDASVQFTWDIMSRYIEKYNLLFFIVDHSGFAASKADLRMVIKDKTLKFFVDDKLQLKDLEFDEDGIAEYNGKKIYRELIGNV